MKLLFFNNEFNGLHQFGKKSFVQTIYIKNRIFYNFFKMELCIENYINWNPNFCVTKILIIFNSFSLDVQSRVQMRITEQIGTFTSEHRLSVTATQKYGIE